MPITLFIGIVFRGFVLLVVPILGFGYFRVLGLAVDGATPSFGFQVELGGR